MVPVEKSYGKNAGEWAVESETLYKETKADKERRKSLGKRNLESSSWGSQVGVEFDRLKSTAGTLRLGLTISSQTDRLVGLVVKKSASRTEDPEFESRLRLDFSGLSHTSDLKIGTPVATLLSAWCCRVSAGTGQPGVSIL